MKTNGCQDGYFAETGALENYVEAWCKTYIDDNGTPGNVNDDHGVWVFNIANFVGMLFDIDPQGSYRSSLIQVRFYPLPLNTKENPKP
ncbi:MAG: hypothetical protein JSW04_01410 [Desulfobacterales bacterium]|nr:MAG: hypothetical protein JSW04_01410 [Desulfobacterales bacterium]